MVRRHGRLSNRNLPEIQQKSKDISHGNLEF